MKITDSVRVVMYPQRMLPPGSDPRWALMVTKNPKQMLEINHFVGLPKNWEII